MPYTKEQLLEVLSRYRETPRTPIPLDVLEIINTIWPDVAPVTILKTPQPLFKGRTALQLIEAGEVEVVRQMLEAVADGSYL